MANKRNRAKKRRAGTQPVVTPAPAAVQAPPRRALPIRVKPQRLPVSPRAGAGDRFERASLAGAGIVGLSAFVVYALTVQHSVPSGDSGELIAAAYGLGVAHPPGYPLYMMIGHLVALLPGGSPALRMNLLSALLDSIAVALVFLTVYRLTKFAGNGGTPGMRRFGPFVAGAVGALLLAFSTQFWAYSVVAEVFALNNLFAASLLLIGLEWARRPDRYKLLWLFMLVLGLAFCNQQTIVLLVPGFAVLAWSGWRAFVRSDRQPAGRRVLIAAGAFLAGLLPYLYLPIAASQHPPLNWGDPESWGRFWRDVFREDYGTKSLVVEGKPGSVSENLRVFFGDVSHGFVFAGLALAVAGLWWAWRSRQRAEGVALLAAFAVAGPAFMTYTNTKFIDQLTRGIIARFYILPTVPLAIAVGLGAWWVLQQADRVRLPSRPEFAGVAAAGVLLLAPTAAAITHFSARDQSANNVAYDYGRDLLGPLPPNSLLLMVSDENLDSVSYAQDVEHYRTDVIAVDTELLKLPATVNQLRREHPDLLVPFASYDGGVRTSLNAMVEANLASRPVYSVGGMKEKSFGKPFDKQIEGLSTRWVAKGSAPDAYTTLAQQASTFASLHYPDKLYPPDSWERAIERDYAYAAFYLGFAIQVDGDGSAAQVALAARMYQQSIFLFSGLKEAYKNLGLILNNHNGDPKIIIPAWETYLRLAPHDPQAPAIRTALARLQKAEKK